MKTNNLCSIVMMLVMTLGVTVVLSSCGPDDEEDIEINNNHENNETSHAEKFYCPDNNHPHAIDLGLPSGIKWACCNVGAKDPIQEGDHFAWGELETKKYYTEDTYKYAYYKNYGYSPNKYYLIYDDKYGLLSDRLELLEREDDVAYKKWGKGWRMPTIDEFEELLSNCTLYYETPQSGHDCHHLVGRNNKDLLVPKTGYYDGDVRETSINKSYYWSRSLVHQNCWYAYCAVFIPYKYKTDATAQRSLGLSVRPVYDENK